MAILHMDVESSRSVANQLMSTQEQIAQLVVSLCSSVNSVVGTSWIAPGADIFRSDINQWGIKERQLLEELNSLINRLQNEINEWEQIASRLE